MSRVKYKYRTESIKIGNKRTVFKWDGIRKLPTVTYVYEEQVIPAEGSLNSVLNSLADTSTPLEEEIVLVSHSKQRKSLLLG